MSYRTFSQVMHRVENVYRLLPPDFFKGNYETYVVNTEDGHMLAFNRKRKEYDVVKQTTFLTEEPLIETTSGTFLKEWLMLQG